jgi:ribosome recycling factor
MSNKEEFLRQLNKKIDNYKQQLENVKRDIRDYINSGSRYDAGIQDFAKISVYETVIEELKTQ